MHYRGQRYISVPKLCTCRPVLREGGTAFVYIQTCMHSVMIMHTNALISIGMQTCIEEEVKLCMQTKAVYMQTCVQ